MTKSSTINSNTLDNLSSLRKLHVQNRTGTKKRWVDEQNVNTLSTILQLNTKAYCEVSKKPQKSVNGLRSNRIETRRVKHSTATPLSASLMRNNVRPISHVGKNDFHNSNEILSKIVCHAVSQMRRGGRTPARPHQSSQRCHNSSREHKHKSKPTGCKPN